MPAKLLGHNLDLVGEPGVGRDDLLVDMNERVKRPGPDRVAVGAVDLGLVALAEVAVGRRAAEVDARVAVVVDLQLGPQAEVLVGFGAVEHGGLAGADDGAVLDLPVAVLTPALGPAAQGCAVEERDPFALVGASSSWTGPSGPGPRDIRRFLERVSWWLIPLSLMAARAASLVQNTSWCHVRSSRAPGKPEPRAGTRPGQAGDARGATASLLDCLDRSDVLASLRHRPRVGQRLLKARWQSKWRTAKDRRACLHFAVVCHVMPSVICHLHNCRPTITRFDPAPAAPGTGSGIAPAAALR